MEVSDSGRVEQVGRDSGRAEQVDSGQVVEYVGEQVGLEEAGK